MKPRRCVSPAADESLLHPHRGRGRAPAGIHCPHRVAVLDPGCPFLVNAISERDRRFHALLAADTSSRVEQDECLEERFVSATSRLRPGAVSGTALARLKIRIRCRLRQRAVASEGQERIEGELREGRAGRAIHWCQVDFPRALDKRSAEPRPNAFGLSACASDAIELWRSHDRANTRTAQTVTFVRVPRTPARRQTRGFSLRPPSPSPVRPWRRA